MMKTVLLVEDDVDLNKAVTRALKIHGYRPVSVFNGQEALDRIMYDTTKIDFIVSDVEMPHLSGIKLYRWLQHCQPSLAAKFAFHTGSPKDVLVLPDLANVPVFTKGEGLRALLEHLAEQLPDGPTTTSP